MELSLSEIEYIEILQSKFGKQSNLMKYIDTYECVMIDNSIGVVMKNPALDHNCALFGYIDFPDDIEIAGKLFFLIEEKAKKMGAEYLIGPINYATWMSYRWMTYGFNNPKVTPEINNYSYMPDIIKKLGYSECFTYSSDLVKAKDPKLNSFKSKYDSLLRNNFIFEEYKGNELLQFTDTIYEFTKEFSKNPLYCHIPYEIFKDFYTSISSTLNPVLHLCKKNNHVCGYSISYKNLEFPRWWIFKNIAVKNEFRNLGIGSALRYLIHESALKNNCTGVVHHFRYDKNFSMKFSKDGETIKRYALFKKKL